MEFPSALALFLILGLALAVTGCTEDHTYPETDILVSKYYWGGTDTWTTTIDSGNDDYATDIIETPDRGYAVAGWVAQKHGSPHNPRVIRLDASGRIRWDRTLDSSDVYSVAIAGAPDGGFVVAQNINNYDAGRISRIGADGEPLWNQTVDSLTRGIVPAGDGRYAVSGTRTFLIDGNGTKVLELPAEATSILPASDGGFFVEQSGAPYPGATVSRFDADGTAVWSRSAGSAAMGKITSLHENSAGNCEVVYTFSDPAKDRDMVTYMESERVTFGKDGDMSGESVVAVDPLTRTADGGYAFLAYPFPGQAAFTTLPHADSTLHMVRLSTEGAVTGDRPVDTGPWAAPQKILQTTDGGYVTLVVTGA
jgi:hypothetical protein